MGKINFDVDFVLLFANIADGEFLEVVHYLPQNPDGPVPADCRGYPPSFSLKFFLKGYR